MTLLQPYVQTVFCKENAWAARHGLKETIIRVSVGLEAQEALLKAFQEAVQKMVTILTQSESPVKLQDIGPAHSFHRPENDSGLQSFRGNICV